MKELTRNQLFEAIGTSPTNPRWSWCAIAKNKERSAFTLWKDKIEKNQYQLLVPLKDNRNRRGYNDLKRILDIVITESIPAYGIVCNAADLNSNPRSISSVVSNYLIPLRLSEKNGLVYAKLGKKVALAEVTRKAFKLRENALLDFADPPSGSSTPDRALRSGYVVKRDPKVRDYVVEKAAGRCEFCGKLGFSKSNGGHYVEAHHIISLGNTGKDTIDNVIALCPDHHRQAHFGMDAEKLEKRFITIVIKRNKKT